VGNNGCSITPEDGLRLNLNPSTSQSLEETPLSVEEIASSFLGSKNE
jgi:hypothetical protein